LFFCVFHPSRTFCAPNLDSPMSTFLIYGANGYTGALIAQEAAKRGLHPVLAGRSPTDLIVEANDLHLPHRIFALDNPSALDAGLEGVALVLNCAGPFMHTAQPMVEACMRRGIHYVDITGEIGVFEALAAQDAAFEAAGIMVLPGAGFDVVPTDLMAAHLKRRLPEANRLTLAFRGMAGLSRGTAATAVESMATGVMGMVREEGVLKSVPSASRTRQVDFGKGLRDTVLIPWGDVSTAWVSTGIPNIEVYMAARPNMVRGMKAGRYLGPLLRAGFVRDFLKYRIHARAAGPTEAARAAGQATIWGRAEAADGRAVESRLTTPEPYSLTVLAALWVAEQVVAGNAPTGYQTPSTAYGPDWILDLPGVARVDAALK
jgi:short subunit dehydrogenase-like uncharacterized protein